MKRLALIALLCSACVNAPLRDSFEGFHAQAGAEWLAYVEADPEMSELDKKARRLLYRAAGRVIEEAR